MIIDKPTTSELERDRLESRFQPLMSEDLDLGRLVSYVGNKKVPFLRLYRYKEAFSTKLVDHFLDYFSASPYDKVFDPFAGLGTTLFTSMMRGIPSVGIDRLPVAAFAASTLPKFLSLESGSLINAFNQMEPEVANYSPAQVATDVPIMGVAFDEAVLHRLRQWKSAIDDLGSVLKDPMKLLFFSILEESSYTAKDGQFLRLLRDKTPQWPDTAFRRKVEEAEQDLITANAYWSNHHFSNHTVPQVILGDTRNLDSSKLGESPTILITSPPYANRYDYTRSYCLELCFDFVQNFQELRTLRHSILRSHIESKPALYDYPNHPVISEVLEALSHKSLNNARIPHMITAYFVDMEKAIRQWQKVMAPRSHVALVVDNVRFEGEMIPADLVLSEIAERHGFTTERVIVARYKGNSSQQMGSTAGCRSGKVSLSGRKDDAEQWRQQSIATGSGKCPLRFAVILLLPDVWHLGQPAGTAG